MNISNQPLYHWFVPRNGDVFGLLKHIWPLETRFEVWRLPQVQEQLSFGAPSVWGGAVINSPIGWLFFSWSGLICLYTYAIVCDISLHQTVTKVFFCVLHPFDKGWWNLLILTGILRSSYHTQITMVILYTHLMTRPVDSLTWSLRVPYQRIELFQVAARRREDGDSALQGVCGSPNCVLVWHENFLSQRHWKHLRFYNGQ